MPRPSEIDTAVQVNEPAVRGLGLSKRYGAAWALRGVDVTVYPARVHGLLGDNGAGKTTLLRLILGLIHPSAGQLSVLGRDQAGEPGRSGVAGFVCAPRFYPYLSAVRNLELLAALDGQPSGDRVDDALDAVGLSAVARQKVRDFSSGQRQRLGIAAALMRDPRLFVLDEPANNLDPAGVADLHALIKNLAATGCAVLLSSHDLSEVDQLCDDVTVLRQGEVAFSGEIAMVRAQAPPSSFLLGTSSDQLALAVARDHRDIAVQGVTAGAGSGAAGAGSGAAGAGSGAIASAGGGLSGLIVRGSDAAVDAFVIALGQQQIAIRSMRRQELALEAVFAGLSGAPETTMSSGIAR